MVNLHPHVRMKGVEKKNGVIDTKGKRTGFYPLREWIGEKLIIFWVCMVFGGSDGGPQGPKWLIYAPMAWIKLVEKKNGSWAVLGQQDGSLPSLDSKPHLQRFVPLNGILLGPL